MLDVHRDAIEDRAGHQYKVITREDPHCAQISFVMGSNNDHWLENVKLAVAVQQKLTDMSPTLMRPLTLRNSNYNQHLTTGSMLVEIAPPATRWTRRSAPPDYLPRALRR